MADNNNKSQSSPPVHTPFTQAYLHGTKADLKPGKLIEVGYNSNFGKKK